MNNCSNLAPIGVSTYIRLGHLKQSIAALQKNGLASQSELHIFSDAAKPGDENKVKLVREFSRAVNGFSRVVVHERIENNRVFNNRNGIQELLDKFGKMIYLEEDVVVSPHFLSYMNAALHYYGGNKDVISICGYCPPLCIPREYEYSVYFLRRFNAWGFGIWKERFDAIKMDTMEIYNHIVSSRDSIKEFIRFGEDMLLMARKDAYEQIDALDVKIMMHQFVCGQYTVYPVKSMVRNIGFDGTGFHCGKTTKFDSPVEMDCRDFIFPGQVFEDNRIVKSNRKFRKVSLLGKVRLLLSGII